MVKIIFVLFGQLLSPRIEFFDWHWKWTGILMSCIDDKYL